MLYKTKNKICTRKWEYLKKQLAMIADFVFVRETWTGPKPGNTVGPRVAARNVTDQRLESATGYVQDLNQMRYDMLIVGST